LILVSTRGLPQIPYGAVYFRKSNPPRADWERDYQVAAADGFNVFRHWFLWGSIEVAPGRFDWSDYDRQFDLAAKYGIKTIIAEMVTAAPEWLFHERPEGRHQHADGRPHESRMGGSSVTGGFQGMSLDDDVVRAAAGNFLENLVRRYRDHPAMGGYDIWNECNYVGDAGYSPATVRRFRAWLQVRYGDLRTLGEAWGRYSYTAWEQIQPPRLLQAFPDVLDWLEFQQDNAFANMRWRVSLIRRFDTDNPITARGIAGSLVSAATNGADDWRAASEVESYGCTWVASRQGDAPWQHLHAMDLTRAASRGKDFWHAEAQGGPLWMQPQVTGRPLQDGRVTEPEDVRLWNLATFCGGARGLLYPRWRPLLNGPLFGAFGPYAMDGARTDRSQMAAAVAHWANADAQAVLWRSRPVRGDIGLIYVPEAQRFDYCLQGTSAAYTAAIRGAYQGFFSANIQADFVHIDDIAEYDLLYLPYPVMLSAAHASRLADWVNQGGALISEGCPGYFGDRGWAGQIQPNSGLDEVFGAREDQALFTPDLLCDLTLVIGHDRLYGGGFRQSYALCGGAASGFYEDGTIAAVDHQFGAGRTRLIGTFPGIGFDRHQSEGSRSFFRNTLGWAGVQQALTTSNRQLTARLFDGAGGRYLWMLNHTRRPQDGRISMADRLEPFADTTVLWGEVGGQKQLSERSINVCVGPRDALVLKLHDLR
jgi:beta-galactosidase